MGCRTTRSPKKACGVAETEALRRFADSATALRPVMATAGAFVYRIRAEDLNQT